ncbi:MAG TPA: putative glycolipid-binding domain-containing protein [Roseiarcus sp.]|nr:putative glycolipid-binding domain-containing protein [Roseiarcus sp.]
MTALWRRLDVLGHDAAQISPNDGGWILTGAAAFMHETGPAGVAYLVQTDESWRTKRGTVRGFVGDRSINFDIRRDAENWRLNGVVVPGLGHLLDLDLSFTPATNLLQLKRAAPRIGESVSLPAAWFSLNDGRLTELPQIYKRLTEKTYDYAAPSVPYRAVLEVDKDGFAMSYPGLWRREG